MMVNPATLFRNEHASVVPAVRTGDSKSPCREFESHRKRQFFKGQLTMKMIRAIGAAAMVAFLSGCVTTGGQQGGYSGNQVGGCLIGGLLGGLVGSHIGGGDGRTAAVAAGSVFGCATGAHVGSQLDAQSSQRRQSAYTYAMNEPPGNRYTWSNDQGSQSGSVSVRREGTDRRTGRYCREFTDEVTIAGRRQQSYGVACRQPDGTWKIEQHQ